MKFQYCLQDPKFRVGSIDIQSISRPQNYKHSFKTGREHHGFIYIVSGSMLDTFQNCEVKELKAVRGDLIFIPKGSIYAGTYTEENTRIKIIQFELISGELPEYLTSPIKIDLPEARDLIEPFFDPSNISGVPLFKSISGKDLVDKILVVDINLSGYNLIAEEFAFMAPGGNILLSGSVDEARAEHGKSLDELFREVFRYVP